MPTTRDIYTQLRRRYDPMLSLALATSRMQQRTGACDLEAVALTMTGLADREEQENHAPCLQPSDLQACRLAAWTFVDEVLLNLPDSQWFAHGLQLRRMGRTDGGRTFYLTLQHKADQALQFRQRHTDEILLLHPVQTDKPGRNPGDGSVPGSTGSVRFSPFFSPAQGAVSEDISLPHLVRSLQRLAADAAADGRDEDGNPALAVCAFMATCLLYGFRGCLYAPERAVELDSLLTASASLVQQLLPAAPVRAGTAAPAAARKKSMFARLGRPGLLFLILAPLLTTAVWYLVCASIINSMTLPWGGQ